MLGQKVCDFNAGQYDFLDVQMSCMSLKVHKAPHFHYLHSCLSLPTSPDVVDISIPWLGGCVEWGWLACSSGGRWRRKHNLPQLPPVSPATQVTWPLGQASKQSCTFWDLTLKRDAGGAGPTQNINFESDLRKGLLAIGQPSACKLRWHDQARKVTSYIVLKLPNDKVCVQYLYQYCSKLSLSDHYQTGETTSSSKQSQLGVGNVHFS